MSHSLGGTLERILMIIQVKVSRHPLNMHLLFMAISYRPSPTVKSSFPRSAPSQPGFPVLLTQPYI